MDVIIYLLLTFLFFQSNPYIYNMCKRSDSFISQMLSVFISM